MGSSATYDFGQAFARLTCLLEDAAGAAAEGQSAGLGIASRTCLVGVLKAALQEAGTVLSEIRSEMQR